MPIEDNIEYIRSQLSMFSNILVREREEQARISSLAANDDRELNAIYSRIRTIRSDLVSPAGNPSAAAIEERVRTEARIRELEALQGSLDDTLERMRFQAGSFGELTAQMTGLSRTNVSELDREKLNELTKLLRQQVDEFGFSTFAAGELTIDEDTYRPQKEGYEIGFETSASDAIRLKWAYQLSLLELSKNQRTNHPGMLLFDEPRQQSSSKVSFGKLLARAAARQSSDEQVIISTSEDLETLQGILADVRCSQKVFPGYVITRLDE